MPDSGFFFSRYLFSYLTLKKEEVQNAVPISFYFPKAGDINLLNLLVCFFVYIDCKKIKKCKMQSHSFFFKGGGHKFTDFLT